MTGTMILIMGFALAYNIIIIKVKFEKRRYSDAWFDLTSLIVLGWLFSGSQGGLAMGSVASAIISTYLFFDPPNFDWIDSGKSKKTKV